MSLQFSLIGTRELSFSVLRFSFAVECRDGGSRLA